MELLSSMTSSVLKCPPLNWKVGYLIHDHLPTYTALLLNSRVGDSSPLAYLHERTCELDIGAFLHCKDSKDLLRALGLWYCKTWGIGENEKVKTDSTAQRCFL